jgi:N-acetyl-gamma-glutamyl-phosphate reductase
MTKRARVAVLGATGFAGAELLRRLLVHPGVEITALQAADHVGEPVAAAHPHLEAFSDMRFEVFDAARAVAEADVVVMGLPPEPSFEVVRAARGTQARILDMSGAFRLRDAGLFEKFYGTKHPLPELLDQFVYGLPELNRERIRGARFVASPGCFATTITLGLLPFARAGLLHGSVHTVAVTGSSGAGKEPSETTHHPVRAGNVRTYRPLRHAHSPEIVTTLGSAGATEFSLEFVPLSGPYVRGIFATSFVCVPVQVTPEDVHRALREAYANEPFVRVPHKRLPEVVAVAGSCYAEVGVAFEETHDPTAVLGTTAARSEGRLVTVFSTLDNLIKGGAGQAVQNLNLMLGLDETTTLVDPGPYP